MFNVKASGKVWGREEGGGKEEFFYERAERELILLS